MAPRLGSIPWNKYARQDKTTICPTCKKEIQTKYDGQIYCNLKCYSNSEKLKKFSRKSFLILNNKLKKWRKGTGGISFINRTTFRKGDPRIKGKNNIKWKGGITKLQEKIRKLPEYKSWRTAIFKRDDWTCKNCGKKGIYLEAHHILEFNSLIKKEKISTTIAARKSLKLWDIKNGISLCKKCHNITKSKYFKNER